MSQSRESVVVPSGAGKDGSNAFVSSKMMVKALEDYARFINEKNVEGCVSLFAEDGCVEDPVGATPICGRAALTEFFQRVVGLPIQFKIYSINPAPGGALAVYEVTGYPEIPNTVDVVTFDDHGKFQKMMAYPKRLTEQ